MNSSSDAPVYNLKAVVHETGLKPDTIRAWERRYGLPDPRRTESGHRLYSQLDINMLKWLIARQNEGMNISRAVVLWRQFQEMQMDPTDAAAYAMISAEPETPVHVSAGDTITQMRDAWVSACLNFDEQYAERIVSQAFALFSVEIVCVELLQRGLATTGEGWFHGRVTVQQEHFASALATRRLEALLAATPTPTRPSRILIGCPPDDHHIFAPMLVSLLLRRRGWDVIFLGADIPLEDLIATTRSARPQLVILSAQLLHTAASLMSMGQLLFNERVPMAYGGRIFRQLPSLRQRIPGHYLGDRIDAAPQVIDQIMALPHAQAALTPVVHEYQEALHHFKANAAQIEADVWHRVGASCFRPEHLEQANQTMRRNISAALMLGDLRFLEPDFVWASEMLGNRYKKSDDLLVLYLQAYLAAFQLHLNENGAIISNWLQHFMMDLADTPQRSPITNGRATGEEHTR
jgi:DNA-binding transcriptional MerR regulator